MLFTQKIIFMVNKYYYKATHPLLIKHLSAVGFTNIQKISKQNHETAKGDLTTGNSEH